MLTARGELSDRVTGLRLGADDYLPKPFAMQELVARIEALGRRYAEKLELILRVGDLTLNLGGNELHRGNRRIELSARELTLLKVLMREPGRVFTRTELCERVWEREHEYDTKLVEVFIGRLRKKIATPPLIHTSVTPVTPFASHDATLAVAMEGGVLRSDAGYCCDDCRRSYDLVGHAL
jgi:two-component system OmpR family response regulator/two-component system copper resistance phosphate regulon response regulator CusR